MKLLFTSQYGAWRHLPRGNAQVRISRTAPKWWRPTKPLWEPALAPNDYVWAVKDSPEWKDRYLAQLEALRKSGELAKIVERLPDGAILLCYERDHANCHRTAVAQFLVKHGLADIAEFQPGKRVLV